MDPADLRATLADALSADEPPDAETLNVACFWMSSQLDNLRFSEEEAAALARRLLRMAGRILIDTATADADATTWMNTREMVLLWIDEALAPLGYSVRPAEGSNQPELVQPSVDWS